ncbi:MAG TPA: HEAT repeat domain-containing protein [Pirellulales bacterium]|nr:HEAT repeat domain-containing protein [Pirellulales bacterium]
MEWDLGARAADREYIRTHAGADAAAIEAGWRPAQAFLEHADPGHRLAALWAIGRTGTQASAAADKVRQLMVSDPDQEVRARAVRTYGGLHAATGNPEAQRQLAAVALNESQRRGLRFSAYDALLSVRGVAFADLPLQRARREAPAKLAQLDAGGADAEWPVQIAWDLVRECATRGA